VLRIIIGSTRPGRIGPSVAGWIAERGGPMKAPRRRLGSTAYPVLEDAPGSYVRDRA